MKRNFTGLSGLMILVLMGTTSLPAQSPKTTTVETYARELRGENIPAGIRSRAATNWPDSAITFTAAGEYSSKQVYTYDADGKQTTKAFDWENNRWVPTNSYSIFLFPSPYSGISYTEDGNFCGVFWPHPVREGGALFSFYFGTVGLAYKVIPTQDAKGNLTRIEFHVYEIANPGNSYLAYSFTFLYNGNGQPVLIEGYNRGDLYRKVTFQWDSNGNLTLYEDYEVYDNQWVLTERCTSSGNGMAVSESYDPWSGERNKTVAKTDSKGNPAIHQNYTWTAGKWYMTHYTVFYPNDLAPAMETGNNHPVDGTNKGSFEIKITLPVDSIAGGSFVIKLPDGFTLDGDNTKLTIEFDGFELGITRQEDNSWLFTLLPKNTRSAAMLSGEAGKTLAHVAYTVDEEVKRGTYDITVYSILFETPGGESIVEPAITVPATLNRWGVGNEVLVATRVWSSGGQLYIAAASAGRAQIYTVAGQLTATVALAAGQTVATPLPPGVYIVAAEGRTWKAVIR
jgi:hypothetical protein